MAEIVGTSGDDTLRGTQFWDSILGRGGDDLILAQGGNDQVAGEGGSDTIYGGNREDVVGGGNGRDWLYGGNFDDTLIGGKGGDRLNGGYGEDLLIGEQGRDRFVFDIVDPELAADHIRDFAQGEDRIVFKREALGPGGELTFIGTGDFSGSGHGEIKYQGDSTGSVVYVDVDGDRDVDIVIGLDTAVALTSDDFIAG